MIDDDDDDDFGYEDGDYDDLEEERTQIVYADQLMAKQDSSQSAYLIVISGNLVGKMYKIAGDFGEMTIGRTPKADIYINDDGVSRKHAKIQYGMGQVQLIDLESTNGTFANGDLVKRYTLQDGDKIQIGSTTILKFSYQDDIEEQFQKQLYDSATRDGLTGAFNKKHFLESLQNEFAFAARHRTRLSLLIFDIDHFKRVNDTHGHIAGDMVLKELSALVKEQLRLEDIFARYGGEEFALLLRETDEERAFVVAERLRRAVERYQFVYGDQVIPVTISLGVATFSGEQHTTPQELIKEADDFLYKAKRSGRNRSESDLLS